MIWVCVQICFHAKLFLSGAKVSIVFMTKHSNSN